MKKKSEVIIILVIATIGVIALIVSTRNKRVPFSRLHAVLEYEAKDIGAILFVIYDVDYERDAECVRNVKPRLVIGDKKLVKRHFDITPKVPIIEGREYIDKIFNAFPDVRGHECPEQGISSMYDAGMVFFTKNDKIFLMELIDHSAIPEGGKVWVAKVLSPELVPVFIEFFDNAWSLLHKRILLSKPVLHMEKSKLERLIDNFEDVDSVVKD